MKIVPLTLSLPGGPATLVPGSLKEGQPRYERNGVELDLDVVIPPDLEAAGWMWHGSVLYRREPGDDLRGAGVDTATFPPPRCFEQAREIERVRAELDQAIRPAPAKPKPQRVAVEPAATSEQLAMELV